MDTTLAKCLQCGYSLRGLVEQRCPECGRTFDRNNPATMWLPGDLHRTVVWLEKPTGVLMRLAPMLSIAACAFGASAPGYFDTSEVVGLYTLFVWGVAIASRRIIFKAVARAGYSTQPMLAILKPLPRMFRKVALVCAILLILRPTLYARFWISHFWLQRTADAILSQPFQKSPPNISDVRGLYSISTTRRCPHGVKLNLDSRPGDGGPGFIFVADDRSECSRFHRGWPLGGGWYTSD